MNAGYRGIFVATNTCRLLEIRDFRGYTLGMPRPKKQPGEVRENVLRIRLTEEERKELDDAAQVKALDTSAWARSELLLLARQASKIGRGAKTPRPSGG